MSLLAQALAKLLADSPSIRAAMKAGKKTEISVRVYRAAEDRWYDLGPVLSVTDRWAEWLDQIARRGSRFVLRFRYNGRDYERPAD